MRMPIFDFKCRGCGMVFDALVRADDKPKCPECDGEMEALPSAPATTFKFADRKAIKKRTPKTK